MDKPVVTNQRLHDSALKTLSQPQKALESKWFYDETGSALFEQITELPEYYPTRTETGILRDHAQRLASYVAPKGSLLELGSGASVKTRILLDACSDLANYIPVDISGPFLNQVAARLQADYPTLNVVPLVADFMTEISIPTDLRGLDVTVFFPGSTIGNLTRPKAVALLKRLRSLQGVGALVLGADLIKETRSLIDAYQDSAGVTAAFNLNLLHRLNREIGATFQPSLFAHEARWNATHSRIEMHLVSQVAQTVDIGPAQIDFATGESIHTENSHKYTRGHLSQLAGDSGWRLAEFLSDTSNLYSVCVLEPR